MSFINPNADIQPCIIIVDAEEPKVSDLNLQVDDVDKTYELECLVKVKSVTSSLENGQTARHQYVLELQDISKFTEEV